MKDRFGIYDSRQPLLSSVGNPQAGHTQLGAGADQEDE